VRVLGVDLAWGLGPAPNETGVVATDESGRVLDAGWTRGVEETASWIERWSMPSTIAMIDAPLVVRNVTGMRECEREIGRRYGRWKVAANCSNLSMPALAGVRLAERLQPDGWSCADGRHGPPASGRWLYEVFPYTTLVGAIELGYEHERPVYKRKPRRLAPDEFRRLRAANCDELAARIDALRDADPPIDIRSHPVTDALRAEPTPLTGRSVKHREDVLDAVLCAWTGLLWLRHGLTRCQVLGDHDGDPPATILAPARDEQRVHRS
jgi:predicted RNase H-like nuclease